MLKRCPYCNKKKKSVKYHVWRVHLKAGKQFSKRTRKRKISAWNKGLTKTTSKILLNRSKRIARRIKQGEIIWKGHAHSNLTRKRISVARKKYLKRYPDKVGYVLNHYSKGLSYPEKYFRKIFKQTKLCFYEQFKVGLFKLDFAFLPQMINIEVDGEQHYCDSRIFEKDKRRTKQLQSLGWKIIRIRWKDFMKLKREKKEDFIKNILVWINNSISRVLPLKRRDLGAIPS